MKRLSPKVARALKVLDRFGLPGSAGEELRRVARLAENGGSSENSPQVELELPENRHFVEQFVTDDLSRRVLEELSLRGMVAKMRILLGREQDLPPGEPQLLEREFDSVFAPGFRHQVELLLQLYLLVEEVPLGALGLKRTVALAGMAANVLDGLEGLGRFLDDDQRLADWKREAPGDGHLVLQALRQRWMEDRHRIRRLMGRTMKLHRRLDASRRGNPFRPLV